ncbi:DEAH-box ATP-dependent RNA helicase prp22, partial [Rhizophlyctis rosea]
MADLKKLEYLSLVSKVSSELLNHIGNSDKTLAEFIIYQHSKSSSVESFKSLLDAAGADLPESFVSNLDRLIRTLSPPGGFQLGKSKKKKGKGKAGAGAV